MVEGGLFFVKAEIKNTGDLYATDVNWNISVKGGLLKLIDVLEDGTIAKLETGDGETVQTSDLIFGFGSIKIKVTVSAPYEETIEKKVDGFVIGPFILI